MAELGRLTPPSDSRRSPDGAQEATERFAAWMDYLRWQYRVDRALGLEGSSSVKRLRGSYVSLRDTVPVKATTTIPVAVLRKVAGKCVEAACIGKPAHKAGHR